MITSSVVTNVYLKKVELKFQDVSKFFIVYPQDLISICVGVLSKGNWFYSTSL